MYLINRNHKFHYEMENLLRVFFPDEKIIVCEEYDENDKYCLTELDGNNITVEVSLQNKNIKKQESFSLSDKVHSESNESFFERKMAIMLFDILGDVTGYTPPWGILTGVRPAKLMSNLLLKHGKEDTLEYFSKELKVTDEKIRLALSVAEKEKQIIENSTEDSYSVYISIPFCPSRCSYCSFISHSNDKAKKLIPEYTRKLCEEIKVTSEIAKNLKLKLRSIYIGGGTPTALDALSLKMLCDTVKENFDISNIEEYTIEAGRPDSLDDDKFDVLRNSGCTRISINPQSFNDEVLKTIGRNHNSEMTVNAMNSARNFGFDNINMDLIAGLPTESFESFSNTLHKAISFNPENITVHTLALKRSSTIVTQNQQTNSGKVACQMLSFAQKTLLENGYKPYYMYRQSRCLGNLENVGWAKEGYECLYNIYMMEECHTVLAVGAGAVTKLKAPLSSEIERIFNYKYPYEYISGFDEIINRKKQIGEFYEKYGVI